MAFRRPGVRVPPAPLVPALRRPLATVVGAHEFRNHFGYYLERAAAGEAVLVTRRGKPLFRLSPASAEVAAHPSDAGGKHEPFLMCDDVHAAGRQPEGKGVGFAGARGLDRAARRRRVPAVRSEAPKAVGRARPSGPRTARG